MVAELDLVSLLLSLIVDRVSARIGLGLGAGVVCNVLSVVGIVWAGHFDEAYDLVWDTFEMEIGLQRHRIDIQWNYV